MPHGPLPLLLTQGRSYDGVYALIVRTTTPYDFSDSGWQMNHPSYHCWDLPPPKSDLDTKNIIFFWFLILKCISFHILAILGIHVSFRRCARIFQPIFWCFSRKFLPAAFLQIHVELHPTTTTWEISLGPATFPWFCLPKETMSSWDFLGYIPLWITGWYTHPTQVMIRY